MQCDEKGSWCFFLFGFERLEVVTMVGNGCKRTLMLLAKIKMWFFCLVKGQQYDNPMNGKMNRAYLRFFIHSLVYKSIFLCVSWMCDSALDELGKILGECNCFVWYCLVNGDGVGWFDCGKLWKECFLR
jgi:hypothetical protein